MLLVSCCVILLLRRPFTQRFDSHTHPHTPTHPPTHPHRMLVAYLVDIVQAKGASSFLWMGAKPIYSARIRFVCLSLAAFLQMQLTEAHTIRLEGAPRSRSGLKLVAQLESEKEFMPFAERKTVLEALKDHAATMSYGTSLSSHLALSLLKDNFLSVCR